MTSELQPVAKNSNENPSERYLQRANAAHDQVCTKAAKGEVNHE
jgi:hypothetical protein